MDYQIITDEQRSDGWRLARCGRLTGSRAADMLAKIKTGEAAARRDYRLQLVTERITGRPQDDSYQSPAMLRGAEMEAAAIAAYEAHSGLLVEATGFISAVSIMAGCSLDGSLESMRGILEVKVPKSATHLKYIRAGRLPSEYLPQVTHNLWISGAEWCDFGSYDDRFPKQLQLVVMRVYRKDIDIAAYEAEALKFLAEVETETAATLKLAA